MTYPFGPIHYFFQKILGIFEKSRFIFTECTIFQQNKAKKRIFLKKPIFDHFWTAGAPSGMLRKVEGTFSDNCQWKNLFADEKWRECSNISIYICLYVAQIRVKIHQFFKISAISKACSAKIFRNAHPRTHIIFLSLNQKTFCRRIQIDMITEIFFFHPWILRFLRNFRKRLICRCWYIWPLTSDYENSEFFFRNMKKRKYLAQLDSIWV